MTLPNFFEIIHFELAGPLGIFLKTIAFFLIFAVILWFLFGLIPAWHQKKQQDLQSLSSRDKTLQVIRDIYVKMWQGREIGHIKNLGPALALYLMEEFGLDQIQFNSKMVRQLRRRKKISKSDARLLFETTKILNKVDEFQFPARTIAMTLVWDLHKFVGKPRQRLPPGEVFRR